MTRKFNEIQQESNNFKKVKLFPMVNVTSDLAQNLLTLNTENRPIKRQTVDRYRTDLNNGAWQFAGDSVKISNQGVLQDGQHRLLAIVATGLPMTLHIQTGLAPEVFTVLDTGANRSAGDTLALAGYKYHNIMSTVVKYINAIYNNTSFEAAGKDGARRLRHKDLLALAQLFNKEMLEEACHHGSMARQKGKFIDSSFVSALWYVLAIKGRAEKATEFLKLLATGDGLGSTSNSSVYLLRNRLIENLASSTKLTMSAKVYLIIYCWNCFIKNKAIGRLPKPKEEFLEILI